MPARAHHRYKGPIEAGLVCMHQVPSLHRSVMASTQPNAKLFHPTNGHDRSSPRCECREASPAVAEEAELVSRRDSMRAARGSAASVPSITAGAFIAGRIHDAGTHTLNTGLQPLTSSVAPVQNLAKPIWRNCRAPSSASQPVALKPQMGVPLA